MNAYFESHTMPIPESGCLVWMDSLDKGGYGKAWSGDKGITAHRLSYKTHVGEIPKGLWVLHKCNVRSCVNPSHLYLGTPLDNQLDAIKAGTQSWACSDITKGEKSKLAKLTKSQVAEMKKIRLETGLSYSKLGIMFHISMSQAHRICTGKRWVYPNPPRYPKALGSLREGLTSCNSQLGAIASLKAPPPK